MYLGITGSKDRRSAVCDCWLSEGHWWRWTRTIIGCQRDIGGSGQGSGVGQVETECKGDVWCGLLYMCVCEGGKD